MSAPSRYNFEVERQLNLEWLDAAKSIWMPYAPHGFFGTFSGLFSDVAIEKIDLAELIGCNASTHFIKVGGRSLIDEHIISGDRVVIDESLPYEKGKKVAVWMTEFNGWTVKRLDITNRGYYLVSDSTDFVYKIKDDDKPLGVVKSILYREY